MLNYWKMPIKPHKGWSLMDVIDVREDGQDEDDTDYETCMMCGKENKRIEFLFELYDKYTEGFFVNKKKKNVKNLKGA